ncbi:MAG: SDR family oxidoreductase [Elusimicrobiota bacterium]
MNDRVCLVTGANSGIGFCTALELSRRGAAVVLGCRDKERGETARDEIRRLSGNSKVDVLLMDLADLASVRAAAAEFRERHGRLHVLINNAGLLRRKRQTTPDGLEATFQSNHLGHFLLTNLLLDVLKECVPARVVTVSSKAHKRGAMRWDDLQLERSYNLMTAYSQSKLANILFTYELARKLEGSGVTANCLHPGVIASGIFRDLPGFIKGPLGLVLTSPEKGAEPSLRLACAPELEAVSGKYFDRMKEADSSPESHDADAAARLWQISAKLCGVS